MLNPANPVMNERIVIGADYSAPAARVKFSL